MFYCDVIDKTSFPIDGLTAANRCFATKGNDVSKGGAATGALFGTEMQ
jgi:hypothetical protein